MHPYRLICLLLSLCCAQLAAQAVFPVKQNGTWRLINQRGKLLTAGKYDLIGNPDEHGYLVAQRNDLLGLLGPGGKTILPVRYEDIQVLDTRIIAVLENGSWRIVNLAGETILRGNYQQLRPFGDGMLAYRNDRGWGVIREDGRELVAPIYDNLELLRDKYFKTWRNGKSGLIEVTGKTIMEPVADEFRFDTLGIVLYQSKGKWGGVSLNGNPLFAPNYTDYSPLGTGYLLLNDGQNRFSIYSQACNRVFRVANGAEVLSFSENYLSLKIQGKVGLMNRCGDLILNAIYQEIQPFSSAVFRTKKGAFWGLTSGGDRLVLADEYDYISPLTGKAAILKSAGRYGFINFRGEVMQSPVFDRVEISPSGIQAFTGQGNGARMTRFALNKDGQLSSSGSSSEHFSIKIGGSKPQKNEIPAEKYTENSNRLLEKYEWFYAANEGRWGVRNRRDGNIVLSPTFTQVEVLPEFGFTLVGLPKSSEFVLERTTFRTTTSFGLLLNDTAVLVTELNLIDLKVEDWRNGSQVARCIFENGRFGLIDRQGRIVRRDLSYLGPYRNGLAPVSFAGQLSGTLSDEGEAIADLSTFLNGLKARVTLSDYTAYDQEFARDAYLICQGCKYGYLDEYGQVVISPDYDKAMPFQRDRAIVITKNGSGIIDRNGIYTVPPAYDKIELLTSGSQPMYRSQRGQQEFGLVDTSGRLRLKPEFEEVGELSNNLIAVKVNGRWGYVDQGGHLQIPYRYDEARSFSEGLAAVRSGGYWNFIDASGDVRSKANFRELGRFYGGLAYASFGQQYGFVDTSGQFAIQAVFDRAYDFENGVARVILDGEYGLIDTRGEWVMRPKYASIQPFQDNGKAIVRLTGIQDRFAIIDRTGRQLSTNYRYIEPYAEGLALVKDQSGYGYIDAQGREKINAVWSQAKSFHNGRAVVRQGGRCGYIDTNGNLIIPCQYSRCLDFDGDRAVVFQRSDRAGLVSRSGKEIIAPSLSRMLHFREGRGLMRDNEQGFYFITDKAALYDGYYEEARPFYHGVAAIRNGAFWGLINHKGLPLILPKFSMIEPFREGLARVAISARYGLVNTAGYEILPAEYAYVEAVAKDLFRVEKGNEVGYITASGRWLWPLGK